MSNNEIKIGPPRCRGLVFDGDSLLMVRFAPPDDGDHWQIPGGGAEEGESLTDCLVRELQEETGLVVEPAGFCYLAHVVVGHLVNPHMYFESKVVGGNLDDASEMTTEESEWFVERRFVKRTETLDKQTRPQHGVWDRVWRDREDGFLEPIYLGAYTWTGRLLS